MTGSRIAICRNESTHRRVVISALEVIQPGLSVVYIAAVAQRIVCAQSGCHGTGGRQDLAPCVIGILDNRSAAGVQDGGNVTLQIGGIVVVRAVVGDRHGSTGCVVGKVQGVAAHGHLA